jgi:hypothetical protein
MPTYQVVVVRFTEPWEKIWELHGLLAGAFTRVTWKMLVYNRRQEDMPLASTVPANTEVMYLRNVGREAYAIHHFLYTNYDQLPDYFIVIPGAWWPPSIRLDALHMILRYHGAEHFLPYPARVPWDTEQHFQVEKWLGNTDINREEVKKQPFTLASIRPFGAWYKARIPVPYTNLVSLCGIFAVWKDKITRYPREMYDSWMKELEEGGPNPEVGHYWERTWYSLFR